MEAKRIDDEGDSRSSHVHLTPAAASHRKRSFLGALLAWMGIDDSVSPVTRSTCIDPFQIADSSTKIQRLPQTQRLAQPEPLAMPEPTALDGAALTTASRPARAVHFAPMTGVDTLCDNKTSTSATSSTAAAWQPPTLAQQGNMSLLGSLQAMMRPPAIRPVDSARKDTKADGVSSTEHLGQPVLTGHPASSSYRDYPGKSQPLLIDIRTLGLGTRFEGLVSHLIHELNRSLAAIGEGHAPSVAHLSALRAETELVTKVLLRGAGASVNVDVLSSFLLGILGIVDVILSFGLHFRRASDEYKDTVAVLARTMGCLIVACSAVQGAPVRIETALTRTRFTGPLALLVPAVATLVDNIGNESEHRVVAIPGQHTTATREGGSSSGPPVTHVSSGSSVIHAPPSRLPSTAREHGRAGVHREASCPVPAPSLLPSAARSSTQGRFLTSR